MSRPHINEIEWNYMNEELIHFYPLETNEIYHEWKFSGSGSSGGGLFDYRVTFVLPFWDSELREEISPYHLKEGPFLRF